MYDKSNLKFEVRPPHYSAMSIKVQNIGVLIDLIVVSIFSGYRCFLMYRIMGYFEGKIFEEQLLK